MDREGNKITFEDKLADDTEDLLDVVVLRMEVERLHEALKKLTGRERQIVEMRYGLMGGEEITQREIGEMLDISRSYVSRIEKKALEKLHGEFEKG